MANQSVTTMWTRTYTRDKIEYQPKGGWDGSSDCIQRASQTVRQNIKWGGHDFCFDSIERCRAVSQPSSPSNAFSPTDQSQFSDSSKISTPVCPYHPVYNNGDAASRMVHCPGDGYASSPPLGWNDSGPAGAWTNSSRTVPQTWNFDAKYSYCGPVGRHPVISHPSLPGPGTPYMWHRDRGLSTTVNHPLEEKRTPQTNVEQRAQSCTVDCYP